MQLPKAATRLRSFEIHKTQLDVAGKSSAFFFLTQPLHAGCGRPGPGGHIWRTFAWIFWLSCLLLAKVILFLESDHTERQREREGGGGVRDWTELTAGVNFAFSSMPNDMHAEERQERLERELKCMSRQRRVSKRTVAYRPAVSIRLSRSLGFPTCLFLVSLLSGPHERRPMASRKEQLSSSFFVAWTTRTLHENLSMGVQKGQVHSKKHKPSKKYFCGRSTQGSPPAGLKLQIFRYSTCTAQVQTHVSWLWPQLMQRSSCWSSLKMLELWAFFDCLGNNLRTQIMLSFCKAKEKWSQRSVCDHFAYTLCRRIKARGWWPGTWSSSKIFFW